MKPVLNKPRSIPKGAILLPDATTIEQALCRIPHVQGVRVVMLDDDIREIHALASSH